nr:hypothetical protein 1634Bnrm2_p141 [Cryptomonas sp.]
MNQVKRKKNESYLENVIVWLFIVILKLKKFRIFFFKIKNRKKKEMGFWIGKLKEKKKSHEIYTNINDKFNSTKISPYFLLPEYFDVYYNHQIYILAFYVKKRSFPEKYLSN